MNLTAAVVFSLLVCSAGCHEAQSDVSSVVAEPASGDVEAEFGKVERGDLFRLCQRIENDMDAANMFLWMHNERDAAWDAFLDHESNRGGTPWDYRLVKFTQTYFGTVESDGKTIRFTIRPLPKE